MLYSVEYLSDLKMYQDVEKYTQNNYKEDKNESEEEQEELDGNL